MDGSDGNKGAAVAVASRVKRSRSPSENVEGEGEGKVELGLTLGLSTNGRFGVDPARMQMRRPPPVEFTTVVSAENGGDHRARGVHAPLMTASTAPSNARGLLRPGSSVSVGRLEPEKLRQVGSLHGSEMRRSPKLAIESRGLQRGAPQTTMTGSSSRHPLPGEARVKEEPTDTVANTSVASEIPLENGVFNKPFVRTKPLGPEHKRVTGYLYKYDKADDIKIVCSCHGAFHSPANFIRHGGGSDEDAAYPLKDILVRTLPS